MLVRVKLSFCAPEAIQMCSRSTPVGPNAWSALGILFLSSGSYSGVFSLGACRSKCIVDAGSTAFVDRKPLGCALARRLSVQIHCRRWKHCFRGAEAARMRSRSTPVGPNAWSTLETLFSSSGSRSNVLSRDACRFKCTFDAGNIVFVERGGDPSNKLSKFQMQPRRGGREKAQVRMAQS